MNDLSRFLELAGIKEKSYRIKQLHEKTLDELEHDKALVEHKIKGSILLTEQIDSARFNLFQIDSAIKKLKEAEETPEPASADSFDQNKESCTNCNKTNHNDDTCKCECHDTGITEAKGGAELQDSQPSAAQEKDDIDNIFNGHDEEKDNVDKLHKDSMGITQDRETKIDVPKEVFSQIAQRIKELKQSIEMYDKTTFKMQYGNKQKAIENLEFIRDKLKMGNMEGFKQAQIHYGTLASIFAGNIFPAKLVDYLHDGQADEKKEVAFSDYMKGDKDKPTENEVPGNAIYKPLDTSIYPQKGEDNVPKK